MSTRCLQVTILFNSGLPDICYHNHPVRNMTLIKSTIALAFIVLVIASADANTAEQNSLSGDRIEVAKSGKEELKHGQYVYVTLKNGSETVGKIVGKKTSKKYYVNQLNGSHHGVVNKKYIRKMTKEEIASFVSENN